MMLCFVIIEGAHRLLRYICRSHQTPIEQLNNHALLSCYPRYSSMNAFEFTFCYNNVVSHLEPDVFRGDGDYVRVLDSGEADEVVHSFVTNGEWWIAFWIVLTIDGVVKVVAEQRPAFNCN